MFFPFSFLVIPAQLVLDPIGERESRGGKEKELIFACAEMTEERKRMEPIAKLFGNIASRYIRILGCVELAIISMFCTRSSQPRAARLHFFNLSG
ncbi:MAG: hypothetical protein DRP83_00425 [Planctomycetota bacterium]|nr:MAG: hypothetical protein DRP83_00425 [Planctomycetota bacterium]